MRAEVIRSAGAWSTARSIRPVIVLSAGLLLAACASEPSRQATVDLTRAQTLTDQAEQNGATQYAPAELQRARDELASAQQLSHSGNQVRAERLATEAGVDAELASARASAGKEQHAAQELNVSLDTLRGAAATSPAVPLPAASPAPVSPPPEPPPPPPSNPPPTSPQ